MKKQKLDIGKRVLKWHTDVKQNNAINHLNASDESG